MSQDRFDIITLVLRWSYDISYDKS